MSDAPEPQPPQPTDPVAQQATPSLWRAASFVPWVVLGLFVVVLAMNLRGSHGTHHPITREQIARAAADASSGESSGKVVVAPDPVDWRVDVEPSYSLAASTGKPILLDFTADWCPTCQQLKSQFYSIPEVKHLIETRFVPVKIDLTRPGGPYEPLAQKLGVQLLPALVVISPDGRTATPFSDEFTLDNLQQWLERMADTGHPAKG